MRRVVTMALGGMVALLGLPAARADDDVKAGLVVHAWGTFTSVSGADGVPVEGPPHAPQAPPDGFDDGQRPSEPPMDALDPMDLERRAKPGPDARVTSVLFFHAPTPRRVRVRFGVPDGAAGTPDAPRLRPAFDPTPAERALAERDVDVVPNRRAAAPETPSEAARTPARVLAPRRDADGVRSQPGPDAEGATPAEPFLVHRGRRACALPMTGAFDGEGRVTFTNGSAHEVAQVIAIEVADGGTRGRHDVACYVQPGERRGADPAHRALLDGRAFEAWGPRGSSGLRGDLAKVLVGQGFARDEAHALVEAWSSSWCATDGLRLLYVVPRPLHDEVLPLTMEPAPRRVVRVLLGRIECLVPARVAAMEAALAECAMARVPPTADAARAHAARDRARALGGAFLEPLLRHVLAVTTEDGARRVAQGWLEDLATEAAAPSRGAR